MIHPFTGPFAAAFFRYFPGWRGALSTEMQTLIQRLASVMLSEAAKVDGPDAQHQQLWQLLEQRPERLGLFLNLVRGMLGCGTCKAKDSCRAFVSIVAVVASLFLVLGLKNHLSARALAGLLVVVQAVLSHVPHPIEQPSSVAAPTADAVLGGLDQGKETGMAQIPPPHPASCPPVYDSRKMTNDPGGTAV